MKYMFLSWWYTLVGNPVPLWFAIVLMFSAFAVYLTMDYVYFKEQLEIEKRKIEARNEVIKDLFSDLEERIHRERMEQYWKTDHKVKPNPINKNRR
jgi:hypothetical protein